VAVLDQHHLADEEVLELDELFEALVLIQTRKIDDFPVVLMGVDYWRPMIEMMQSTLIQAATIDKADLHLLFWTDSPDEAAAHIQAHALPGVRKAEEQAPRPHAVLLDKPPPAPQRAPSALTRA
jgi:hypothetical protein